ncbi:hypothetical protein SEA_JKERNS_44 [Arthrobacter phage JKerns]|uniref:Uncharacterized protein n=2 Tax=Marthavirus zartrosa TaxID=2843736 RepID=A0A6G9LDV5_9CAUD|nr:hypothetical protein HYP98_gp44 [Arthrobacter phage Zartrosa]QED11156.1 hypothetical protein SEA_ZARTROSA_44 [Arthrobacter phage Zartrosa]QIQ62856.1 hypothetical protein SEA_JKERNS_44 [Arthrobacter phage JKerns]
MSAEVREETTYVGYCPECNTGSDETFSFQSHAEQWVEAHDAESHAPADSLEELAWLMTERDIEIDAELETADEMTRNDHK